MQGRTGAFEDHPDPGSGHGGRLVRRRLRRGGKGRGGAKLINALDTAHTKEEVEAVITEHSATVEAQVAATDAEVKSRGDQTFLGQQFKEQRITTDVKQEIQRAEKAAHTACQ